MDQLRFDPLTAKATAALGRNSAPTPVDGGDPFSQILDQQLAQRSEAAPRREQGRRTGDDAADRARSEAARQAIAKRRDSGRDGATARQASASRHDDSTPRIAAKPAAARQRNATDDDARKATAAASDDADAKTDTPADGSAAAAKAGDVTTTAKIPDDTAAGGSDGDQTGEHPSDGDPAGRATDANAAAPMTTGTDPAALLALGIPTLGATAQSPTSSTTDPLSGQADPALAAALTMIPDALLATGGQPAGGASGQGKAVATPAGLSFGAVIAETAKAATASGSTAGQADALAADGQDPAAALDPMATAAGGGSGIKPAGDRTTSSAKTRNAASHDNAVASAADQNGKPATAAAIQTLKAGTAATWNGAGPRNELSESLTVSAGSTAATADSEFSTWSQYLGSGAMNGLSSGLTARQAAFLAQLRQNLPTLPPHEQIAVQIQGAMQNGTSRLTVDLKPAELGRVEIKLDVDKDKNVTATVIVDRPATLDMLQRDAKALERALQDAGLQTSSGSLSFSLRDSSGQAAGNGQGGNGGPGSGSGTVGNAGAEAANQPIRADVVATADGYVDLET